MCCKCCENSKSLEVRMYENNLKLKELGRKIILSRLNDEQKVAQIKQWKEQELKQEKRDKIEEKFIFYLSCTIAGAILCAFIYIIIKSF